MDRRLFLSSLVSALFVGGAGHARTLKPYTGPEITRVVLFKKKRKLYLISGSRAVAKFRVGLGNQPVGPKRFEGDGRTPEGAYLINRRNPNSEYHLSLGISYPNAADIAYAEAHGKRPGGDIFIHGRAGQHIGKGRDWTAGCIAVRDREIEKIWMMVKDGTQIDIFP